MNINHAQLEAAFSLCARGIKEQDLPAHMKKRWVRALEKAKERLIEQPFFALHLERLLIVSVPSNATNESAAGFMRQTNPPAAALIKRGCVRHFLRAFRAGIARHFCF